MPTPRVFNPDDYLWTPDGRVYTDERNAAAWEQLYSDIETLFSAAGPETRLFLVMGVQGEGRRVNASLEQALIRNAQRPADEVVPECAVRSVFGLLEAPTVEEGFDEVIVVSDDVGFARCGD